MRRLHARACGLGLALAPVCACGFGDGTTCTFANDRVAGPAGLDSVAFRVRSEPGAVDEIFGGYRGSVTNRSTETPCAFALYEFDAPPDLGAILPVVVGELPPETHPGGGRLIHHGVLPAIGDHTFEVSLVPRLRQDNELAGFDDSEVDTTVVLSFCEQPDVDLELLVEMFLCKEGDSAPVVPADLVRQLW